MSIDHEGVTGLSVSRPAKSSTVTEPILEPQIEIPIDEITLTPSSSVQLLEEDNFKPNPFRWLKSQAGKAISKTGKILGSAGKTIGGAVAGRTD